MGGGVLPTPMCKAGIHLFEFASTHEDRERSGGWSFRSGWLSLGYANVDADLVLGEDFFSSFYRFAFFFLSSS